MRAPQRRGAWPLLWRMHRIGEDDSEGNDTLDGGCPGLGFELNISFCVGRNIERMLVGLEGCC